jgi:hypothetical protein
VHRLYNVTAALTVAVGMMAAVAASGASAQQKQAKRPPQRPQIIVQDRWPYGPPPPPSSERNYYGPAPGIQPPMERVPLPPPLSQPPIGR